MIDRNPERSFTAACGATAAGQWSGPTDRFMFKTARLREWKTTL
jgi:hypothetical protein